MPVPIGVSVTDSLLVSEAVARDDMFSVDINPAICPDAPLCRPMLRGWVVWRDFNHLTAKITMKLRNKIWGRFEASGALDGLDFPPAPEAQEALIARERSHSVAHAGQLLLGFAHD